MSIRRILTTMLVALTLLASSELLASAEADPELAHLAAETAELAERRSHEQRVRNATQARTPSSEPQSPHNLSRGLGAIHTVGVFVGCDFPTLQDAVNAASAGDEIRMAGITFTSAAATANINKELTIRGGYNVLCGGLDSSVTTTLDASGQVDSVLEISADVTLENMTLTGGEVDGDDGGGIEIESADVILNDVIIRDNESTFGGGIYLLNGSLLVNDSAIYQNTATDSGGGIFCQNSSIDLRDSDLGNFLINPLGNTALSGGGAYLDDCSFEMFGAARVIGNSAEIGGGIYATNDSRPSMLVGAMQIVSNSATNGDGGGVYLDGASVLSLQGGIVSDNTASSDGGAVYAVGDSAVNTPVPINCGTPRCLVIANNSATSGFGGAFYARNSELTVVRSYIENNMSEGLGSAIYPVKSDDAVFGQFALAASFVTNNSSEDNFALRLFNSSSATLPTKIEHVTLADNSAVGLGLGGFEEIGIRGQIVADPLNNPVTLSGLLVWGSSSRDVIEFVDGAAASVTCSLLPANAPFPAPANVIGADPLFFDPAGNNYHIPINSPAVDNCAAPAVSTLDADRELYDYDAIAPLGNTLPNDGVADSGADEARALISINSGICSYGTMREAIDAASEGDTLYVGSQINEVIGSVTKSLTIHGASNDCLTPNENTDSREVLSAEDAGRVFELAGGATLIMKFMHARDGLDAVGGAISVIENSTLIVDQSIVSDSSSFAGGGIYVRDSTLLINGSSLLRNDSLDGAALYALDSSVVMTSTGIAINNVAVRNGGGIYMQGTQLTLNNLSRIEDSEAVRGGGVYVVGTTPEEASHLFLNGNSVIGSDASDDANTASIDGGGLYLEGKYAQVTLNDESRIEHNLAEGDGGGVYAIDGAYVKLNDDAAVSFNSASLTDGAGGGIFAIGSSTLVQLSGAAVVNNNQADAGGGLYVVNGAALTMGDSAEIRANSADSGGGAYLAASAMLDASYTTPNERPTFLLNEALTGAGQGGGLYTELTSDITLTGIDFDRNEALIGGGAYVTNATVELTNVVFDRNEAQEGGGLALRNNANVTIDAEMVFPTRGFACDPTALSGERYCSEFFSNVSDTSSAIDVLDSVIDATHTSFNVNHGNGTNGFAIKISGESNATFDTILLASSYQHVGGIFALGTGDVVKLTILNSTLADNAGWPLFTDADTVLTLRRSIVWDNDAGPNVNTGATLDTTCNIVQTAWSGSQSFGTAQNLNADPLFVGTARGSYFLASNSPAIDACNGVAGYDLENVGRSKDGDGSASPTEYDMGAFEYDGAVATAVGLNAAGVSAENPPIIAIFLLILITTNLLLRRQVTVGDSDN